MDRFEGKLPAPYHINVTKGSVHIVAVRGFVEYVIHNRTAIKFLDWVKDTYIPDETFFSSLNHNPHLRVPGSYLGLLKTNCYCQIIYAWVGFFAVGGSCCTMKYDFQFLKIIDIGAIQGRAENAGC